MMEMVMYITRLQQRVLYSPEIKIIDYEGSIPIDGRKCYLVGTCEYRAPEVSIGETASPFPNECF